MKLDCCKAWPEEGCHAGAVAWWVISCSAVRNRTLMLVTSCVRTLQPILVQRALRELLVHVCAVRYACVCLRSVTMQCTWV
jgi:hypothetical protein